MRLVSRTRLLPAFVAVALALPASASAQSTGGASAPPPQPASDVALVASPQALLGRERDADRHRLAPRPRPRPAGAALRRGRPALALGGAHHGRAHRPLPRPLEPAGARPAAAPRDAPAPPLRERDERLARGLRARLQAGHGHLVRPRALRQHDRVRAGAHAASSSASPTSRCPAARWSRSPTRGRSIVVPVVDRGPYAKGMTLGPHLGRGRAARLHRDGAHRRARPAGVLAQSR